MPRKNKNTKKTKKFKRIKEKLNPKAFWQESRRDKYNEYLKSTHWKLLRKEVLERDDYRCRFCNKPQAIGAKLEVHHRRYDLYGEQKNDLLTLCSDCHRTFHKFFKLY